MKSTTANVTGVQPIAPIATHALPLTSALGRLYGKGITSDTYRYPVSASSKKRFEELGLSYLDERLYREWVSDGVYNRTPGAQRRFLAMFERLAAKLKVSDPIPSVVFRGYTFKGSSDAAKIAKTKGRLRLKPKVLTSWSGKRREAMQYLRDRWGDLDRVNLLVSAKPVGVVLVIGPRVRRYLSGGNPYYHANDYEVILRGNPITVLTPQNSEALDNR